MAAIKSQETRANIARKERTQPEGRPSGRISNKVLIMRVTSDAPEIKIPKTKHEAKLEEIYIGTCSLSRINLAPNNVQLPTPHLSPYLNTNSLFAHGFPSLIQRSSSEQPSTHSFQSSCPTQMPLDPYSRITRT